MAPKPPDVRGNPGGKAGLPLDRSVTRLRRGLYAALRVAAALRAAAALGFASLYVPADHAWSVTATTPLELGVCTAPGSDKLAARVIAPQSIGQETRGKGTNTRYVTNILPETEPAQSLIIVEVITPAGHSSSYPPHRHDRDVGSPATDIHNHVAMWLSNR